MRKRLIFLLIVACAAVLSRIARFNYPDIYGGRFDVTWDEITEDLWL